MEKSRKTLGKNTAGVTNRAILYANEMQIRCKSEVVDICQHNLQDFNNKSAFCIVLCMFVLSLFIALYFSRFLSLASFTFSSILVSFSNFTLSLSAFRQFLFSYLFLFSFSSFSLVFFFLNRVFFSFYATSVNFKYFHSFLFFLYDNFSAVIFIRIVFLFSFALFCTRFPS